MRTVVWITPRSEVGLEQMGRVRDLDTCACAPYVSLLNHG
jgi:hypothetical protein